MAWIQRQINLARFENSEDSGNQRCTMFHKQRDRWSFGFRTVKNLNSQGIRTLVQFSISPFGAVCADRDVVAVSCYSLREPFGNGLFCFWRFREGFGPVRSRCSRAIHSSMFLFNTIFRRRESAARTGYTLCGKIASVKSVRHAPV